MISSKNIATLDVSIHILLCTGFFNVKLGGFPKIIRCVKACLAVEACAYEYVNYPTIVHFQVDASALFSMFLLIETEMKDLAKI